MVAVDSHLEEVFLASLARVGVTGEGDYWYWWVLICKLELVLLCMREGGIYRNRWKTVLWQWDPSLGLWQMLLLF